MYFLPKQLKSSISNSFVQGTRFPNVLATYLEDVLQNGNAECRGDGTRKVFVHDVIPGVAEQ